ncbi:MAG: ribonuclease III [Timaviella obliquedivisa GSE-PSE-MK23-08B]|jgi:ribonuclease-3|nr:ribonuclease III [Timaviella obliquedivisa GSE-PSE-MK23-08B]
MFEFPQFHDRQLRDTALTHRSYLNEHTQVEEHNERLEFLGDALLNFLSGEFLYKRYPEKPEGELTPLRAALVEERQLAKFAEFLGIGQLLRMAKGTELNGGRENANLMSSGFEALIGAYFLDQHSNVDPVREYIELFFAAVVDELVISASSDNYKSRFQEWSLAKTGEIPRYTIAQQSGPDHDREWEAEVWIGFSKYGDGKGRKKQDAEKNAAKNALRGLGLT